MKRSFAEKLEETSSFRREIEKKENPFEQNHENMRDFSRNSELSQEKRPFSCENPENYIEMKTFSQISREKSRTSQENLEKRGFFHYKFEEIHPKPLKLRKESAGLAEKGEVFQEIPAKTLDNTQSLQEFKEKSAVFAENSKKSASFPQITDFQAKFLQLKEELQGISAKIHEKSERNQENSEKLQENRENFKENPENFKENPENFKENRENCEENLENFKENSENPAKIASFSKEFEVSERNFAETPAKSSQIFSELADFEHFSQKTEKFLIIHSIIDEILCEIPAKPLQKLKESEFFAENLCENCENEPSLTEISHPLPKKFEETAKIAKNSYKSLSVAELKAKWLEKQARFSEKPASFSEKPAIFTEKPVFFSKKPSNLSEKPSNLSEKPPNFTKKHSILSEKPANLSEKPSIFSEKPPNFSRKPSNLSEKPSNIQEKPSNIQEKPSNIQENPENLLENRQNLLEKPENDSQTGDSLKNVKELFEENQKILRNSRSFREKPSVSLRNLDILAEKRQEIVRCFSEKTVEEMKTSVFLRENPANTEKKPQETEEMQEFSQENRTLIAETAEKSLKTAQSLRKFQVFQHFRNIFLSF